MICSVQTSFSNPMTTPAGVPEVGLLDTSALVDLPHLTVAQLPTYGLVSAVSLAELLQGVHLAKDAAQRAARIDHARNVELSFPAPLPFEIEAARAYATLVGLTIAAGRHPRPRRVDLMTAATAVANQLPLFTRNIADFVGLQQRLLVVGV